MTIIFSLIKVQLKLLYRNRRTRDILVIFLFSGITLWCIAIHEFISEEIKYSYINSTFVASLTVVSFMIPIALSSNLFSFYYQFTKCCIQSSSYTEYQVTKSIIVFLSIFNLGFNFIFLLPLFYINSEVMDLLSLVLVGTGILIPVSILISSTKISSIDISKSKTYNYSGINATIIFLIVLLIILFYLLFPLSNFIFKVSVVLPVTLGICGVLFLPFWIKIISNRLYKVKNKFV